MTESARIIDALVRQAKRDEAEMPSIDPAKEASGGTTICGAYRWREDGTAEVCQLPFGHEGRHKSRVCPQCGKRSSDPDHECPACGAYMKQSFAKE